MAVYSPSKKSVSDIKSKLLRPSLTSHFQCWFNPPSGVIDWVAKRGLRYDSFADELISLLCCEASLPGSQLATNEVTTDYHGLTERLAYRRIYDDRADFTFYVDHNVISSTSYNIIWLFENWISYCMNETSEDTPYYSYRANFAKNYRSDRVYINKFERDFLGTYLQYIFLKAYPISITSIPVTYDSSQLLKCTVSFAFDRYIVKRLSYGTTSASSSTTSQEPAAPKVTPSASQPTTPEQQSQMNSDLAIWALSNQNMINDVGHTSTDVNNDQKQILEQANKNYPLGSPQREALLQTAKKYDPNVKF